MVEETKDSVESRNLDEAEEQKISSLQPLTSFQTSILVLVKMQEIPSDVLLLAIDYLDSPTMINCRRVSKKWLDVVDGNRSLYSFFYLPKDSKPFSQEMFDLLVKKSTSGSKVVSIAQEVDQPERLRRSRTHPKRAQTGDQDAFCFSLNASVDL